MLGRMMLTAVGITCVCAPTSNSPEQTSFDAQLLMDLESACNKYSQSVLERTDGFVDEFMPVLRVKMAEAGAHHSKMLEIIAEPVRRSGGMEEDLDLICLEKRIDYIEALRQDVQNAHKPLERISPEVFERCSTVHYYFDLIQRCMRDAGLPCGTLADLPCHLQAFDELSPSEKVAAFQDLLDLYVSELDKLGESFEALPSASRCESPGRFITHHAAAIRSCMPKYQMIARINSALYSYFNTLRGSLDLLAGIVSDLKRCNSIHARQYIKYMQGIQDKLNSIRQEIPTAYGKLVNIKSEYSAYFPAQKEHSEKLLADKQSAYSQRSNPQTFAPTVFSN
ncbi:hypothetical protein PAPHI01_1330 [Pancytospora philotis]|nr:hypothetical protein PAPHI01_1330 [Pancytospora philotis]